MLKIVLIAAGVFVVLGVLAIGSLWHFMPDLCGNSVLAEAVAPGGRVKAVTFSRDCGATTGYSTQVSILDADDSLPNDSGNTFMADSDHGRAPTGPHGGPAITITWVSDKHLRITHHPLVRLFKTEPQSQGVKIEYATANTSS